MTKNHHEIIICGAGMIGLTFALLMAEKKMRVCIIDKNDKKLLFTSNRSGSPQIFEIKLSNKRIKRVTLEGSYNSRSRFFPDGRNIVFVHGNNGVFHIATRNLKERFINIVTETKLDESPTISPNGHIIIYSAKKNDQGYLAGITLDRKSKFELPVKIGSVREPAWSPFLN